MLGFVWLLFVACRSSTAFAVVRCRVALNYPSCQRPRGKAAQKYNDSFKPQSFPCFFSPSLAPCSAQSLSMGRWIHRRKRPDALPRLQPQEREKVVFKKLLQQSIHYTLNITQETDLLHITTTQSIHKAYTKPTQSIH